MEKQKNKEILNPNGMEAKQNQKKKLVLPQMQSVISANCGRHTAFGITECKHLLCVTRKDTHVEWCGVAAREIRENDAILTGKITKMRPPHKKSASNQIDLVRHIRHVG